MIIDLVGALASGLGLLGVVMLLNRLLGRRFGRWIYPATVALGMIAYSGWADYTWASRTLAAQPQLRLASSHEQSVFYRPWSYIWPQVNRMITVDLSQTSVHAGQPDLVLTRLVLLGRWEPVRAVEVMFNCANHTQAVVMDPNALNADGTLSDATWTPLEATDPVLATACAAGEEIRHARGNGA